MVTWSFRTFVERHGLPPITVHGLRHTFASLANSARIPLVDIGKALGHKDVSITGGSIPISLTKPTRRCSIRWPPALPQDNWGLTKLLYKHMIRIKIKV